MKKLLLISLGLFAGSLFAQTPYESSMKKALGFWSEQKNEEAAALFQRIAKVDKEQWLPNYYQALIYTTSALREPVKEKKEALIQQANQIISSVDSSTKSAEWYVVEALAKIAELTIDPMQKAPTLSPQIVMAYKKALALDPKNPRALAGLVDFEMQSKNYFNEDISKSCQQLVQIEKMFDEQKSEIPFYPTWGKERVSDLLKNDCVKHTN